MYEKGKKIKKFNIKFVNYTIHCFNNLKIKSNN